MSWFGEYVSVSELAQKARKDLLKLQRKGIAAEPVDSFKGQIAKSFWGKKWCANLENYADMEYRAARGRRYVRAGSVCHLGISPGKVEGYVSGTRLYRVEISMAPIDKARWQDICAKCSRDIGSLVELLNGKLSRNVMDIVSSQESGLFPAPDEVKFSCSCPDGASMCKHVAAMLYGIGRRLDEKPELLFTLRGVNPEELVGAGIPLPETEAAPGLDNLGEIFGIDLDTGDLPEALPGFAVDVAVPGLPISGNPDAGAIKKNQKAPETAVPTRHDHGTEKKRKDKREKEQNLPPPPFNPARPTVIGIRTLRQLAALTQEEFAKKLGVSVGTVVRWENATTRLQTSSRLKLEKFQEQLLKSVERNNG